ncbi:uncharacterized protein EI97DRAFT_73416 [Westerdykella ornata]|uniref:Geranylgeranyl pyrophosphate synthetase n=1 Tax=Westerdykella ornata TaxID=318751 RepID=A0A6A6JHD6_WESOR|nr:uncharacterized protein EI97DRAFT_73416 [Westerdykella ornata]KAF2275378.1 hypothetical protein EI97DRAFT_73416 [Westerdykella ornata]
MLSSIRTYLAQNTGPLLLELSPDDVTPSQIPIHKAFTTICSYNWKIAPLAFPTIFVPGAPRKYVPLPLPQHFPLDQGTYYMNENAYRAPRHRYEPMFQAMAIMQPDMRMNAIDVVVDRGCLKPLMEVAGKKNRRKPFCIAAQRIRNTLFLRVAGGGKDLAHGNGSRGHSFEKAFTMAFMGMGSDALSHYRVHEYDFGGLRMLVRCEVDAFYEHPDYECAPETAPSPDQYMGLEDVGLKGHADATRVTIRGKDVAPHKMAEIKSRVKGGDTVPRDVISQMWLGRTPWLIRGKHKDGKVSEVTVTNEGGYTFDRYELGQQDVLRRTAGLLTLLREVVGAAPGQKAMLVWPVAKAECLEVREMISEPDMIPGEFVERFWLHSYADD